MSSPPDENEGMHRTREGEMCLLCDPMVDLSYEREEVRRVRVRVRVREKKGGGEVNR